MHRGHALLFGPGSGPRWIGRIVTRRGHVPVHASALVRKGFKRCTALSRIRRHINETAGWLTDYEWDLSSFTSPAGEKRAFTFSVRTPKRRRVFATIGCNRSAGTRYLSCLSNHRIFHVTALAA